MPYLIDGHNLIPKIPGLSLEAPDDEIKLVELLLEYCRRRRKQAEVFFDKAPVGVPRIRKYGLVVARFVREGQTADDAIRSRLTLLGRQARNWTVVSSDQAVQSSARAARTRFISSEAFTQEIITTMQNTAPEPGKQIEPSLSKDEIDAWLDMFNSGPGEE